MMEITVNPKKKEYLHQNGLKCSDIELISLLVECQLLLVKARLDKFTVREIIYNTYNGVKTCLERSIIRNRCKIRENYGIGENREKRNV